MDRLTAPAIKVTARPVWLTSALAFLVAAVATELYGLVARGAGIPMAAGNPGGDVATPITVGMFAMATALVGIVATILAAVVARYASNPAGIYLRTTVVLAAVSCAAPMSAGDTALSTKLMLCGGHVIAAAIVIPIVTRRLRTMTSRHVVAKLAVTSPPTRSSELGRGFRHCSACRRGGASCGSGEWASASGV